MNKDDIKKALECCRKGCPIGDCPYYGIKDCENNLFKDAIELITEQEKEIDALKAENEKVYTVRNDLLKENDEFIKTNAELLLLTKQAVKQAKIDVLVELRNKCHNYYPSIDHYCCSVKAVNLNDINKMIEELKK